METSRQSQTWTRRVEPLLSNCPPQQQWCKCGFYCPRVIHANGRFRMWFVGGDTPPIAYARSCLGYAESTDGIRWEMFPDNPVVRPEQVPWPTAIVSTPWVIHDEEESIYKMWCGTCPPITQRRDDGYAKDTRAKLAYATSEDGLSWKFHPEPLAEGTHAPCVHKCADGYRMWINDRPNPTEDHMAAYAHVFEYRSRDGVRWTRLSRPVVAAGGITATCVYPCVLKLPGGWFMWHIGHLKAPKPPLHHPFEIFCDRSEDGENWELNHDRPAFAAADDQTRFDWKFISTPCVIPYGDELYMFYAGSNFDGEFNRYEGRSDGIGMHFGLATIKVKELSARATARRNFSAG